MDNQLPRLGYRGRYVAKETMPSGYINTQLLLDDHLDNVDNYIQPAELAQYESRPCTLFTFTRQPTDDRFTTRIGGLAAWPESDEWPICEDCEEHLAFVAQFDFRENDSVHFDTLLFHYCFECNPWEPSGAAVVTLLNLDPTTELVDESIVPVELEDNEPGPCFGVPHQLVDYSDDLCAMATKIGGFPPEIQPRQTVTDSAGKSMKFLACLGGLDGMELEKIESTPAVGDLTWGDVGCIYFWYSPEQNEVSWTWACY